MTVSIEIGTKKFKTKANTYLKILEFFHKIPYWGRLRLQSLAREASVYILLNAHIPRLSRLWINVLHIYEEIGKYILTASQDLV